MNNTPFTYSVLQYVHDPAIGECINIGVLVCCVGVHYLDIKIVSKYEHLSHTFSGFSGEHYKNTIARVRHVCEREKKLFTEAPMTNGLFSEFDLRRAGLVTLSTSEDVVARIIPDNGLSFRFSEMRAGVTDNPEKELDYLFDLLVTSQRVQHRQRNSRTDDQIWTEFSAGLGSDVKALLRPHEIVTDKIEWKFDHVFRNANLHVIQPVSMDYSDSDYIMLKAAKWTGIGHALEGNKDLAKLYLLLGRPQNTSLIKSYIKAKNLLNDIPVDKEFIEESDLVSWSKSLRTYMQEHGVLSKDKTT